MNVSHYYLPREPRLYHLQTQTKHANNSLTTRARRLFQSEHLDADLEHRLFGFLLGTATAGAGMYYYVIDEYRISNQLLTEDIYALQSAVQRIEGYVRTLEEKVGEKRR